MVNQAKKKLLLSLYTTPSKPHCYGSIESLFRVARVKDPTIKRKDVIEFLYNTPSYTLHKITRKKFKRRRIISFGPGLIASADLADMHLQSQANDNYIFILVFIDQFSRFAQCIPLKRKDGLTVSKAFRKILDSEYFPNIKKINTDEGKEFYNKHVEKLLREKNIDLYSVHSREVKASIAERFIRTLKGKIHRYITHNNTTRYIDALQHIVQSYNNSAHRTLNDGQTPRYIHSLVDPMTIQRQYNKMYKNVASPFKYISLPIDIGQTVRIADEKRNSAFRKGYTVQNTLEIFKVHRIDKTRIPYCYYLIDLQGEEIKGCFYREELVVATLPKYYHIDILKTKTVKGRKKFLIKWRGYPESFNSWVDEADVKPI